MPKLSRKFLKLFSKDATNNGQFGSGQLGTDVLSDDPEVIQNLTAWDNGWLDATLSGQKLPPLEEMQGLQYVSSYHLSYLYQEGIPEWNSLTTYHDKSFVKFSGTNEIYSSKTNDNINNLPSDTDNWEFLQDLKKDIEITMGFESAPTSRKLVIDGRSIAKTSGATISGKVYFRAFEYLWNNVSDAIAPVSSGRGASALADWDANKNITMPDLTDMTPMMVGSFLSQAAESGGSLTESAAGSVSGTYSTTGSTSLTISQIPPHTHQVDEGRPAFSPGGNLTSGDDMTNTPANFSTTSSTGGGAGHTHPGGTISGTLSGSPTSVVQPVFGVYYYINY